MNPDQIVLVQRSFDYLLPCADTAAALFYGRLFKLDPSLRSLFRGDLAEQGRKLMIMLRIVVKGLHRLDVLLPSIEALGRQHAAYGVTAQHYATVGTALLWTLHQGLGERFTPDVRGAWACAYTLLAETMQAVAVAPALVKA